MATPGKLSPEDEYRKLKGLGPDVSVPVSMESPTFPPDQARNLEIQRDRKPIRVLHIGPAPAARAAASGARPMSTVEAARSVLDKAALASDIATIGFAAGGVTAPLVPIAKGVGWGIEAGLGAVNSYDRWVNGNRRPLDAQLASLPAHLLPGGRVLQKGLRTVRGPAGLLRDSAGRFRNSRLNNGAVKEAGDVATESYLASIADRIFNK